MKMVSFICNDDGTFAPCSQGGEDFLAEYRAALQERDAALEGELRKAKAAPAVVHPGPEEIARIGNNPRYCPSPRRRYPPLKIISRPTK